jgi:hypothetical protein
MEITNPRKNHNLAARSAIEREICRKSVSDRRNFRGAGEVMSGNSRDRKADARIAAIDVVRRCDVVSNGDQLSMAAGLVA